MGHSRTYRRDQEALVSSMSTVQHGRRAKARVIMSMASVTAQLVCRECFLDVISGGGSHGRQTSDVQPWQARGEAVHDDGVGPAILAYSRIGPALMTRTRRPAPFDGSYVVMQ